MILEVGVLLGITGGFVMFGHALDRSARRMRGTNPRPRGCTCGFVEGESAYHALGCKGNVVNVGETDGPRKDMELRPPLAGDELLEALIVECNRLYLEAGVDDDPVAYQECLDKLVRWREIGPPASPEPLPAFMAKNDLVPASTWFFGCPRCKGETIARLDYEPTAFMGQRIPLLCVPCSKHVLALRGSAPSENVEWGFEQCCGWIRHGCRMSGCLHFHLRQQAYEFWALKLRAEEESRV